MTTTLYHSPMACSLAVRIAAEEADLPLDICYVDLATKKLHNQSGSLFDVNPLGQVSVLVLDDGTTLSETSTCIAWVQAHSSNSNFKIEPDSPDYFQMLRWLAFCATELHKQIFRVVFYPEATDEVKQKVRQLAPQRFEFLNRHLKSRRYLLGDHFSSADAYLSWTLILSNRAKIDPSNFPHLNRYHQDILARKSVSECLEDDRQAVENRL